MKPAAPRMEGAPDRQQKRKMENMWNAIFESDVPYTYLKYSLSELKELEKYLETALENSEERARERLMQTRSIIDLWLQDSQEALAERRSQDNILFAPMSRFKKLAFSVRSKMSKAELNTLIQKKEVEAKKLEGETFRMRLRVNESASEYAVQLKRFLGAGTYGAAFLGEFIDENGVVQNIAVKVSVPFDRNQLLQQTPERITDYESLSVDEQIRHRETRIGSATMTDVMALKKMSDAGEKHAPTYYGSRYVSYDDGNPETDLRILVMCMEFIDGGTVKEYIRNNFLNDRVRDAATRKESVEYILQACIQMVAMVDHLHQLGMVNNDLKPSNTMVRKNGEIVVLDFGTVKSSNHRPHLKRRVQTKALQSSAYQWRETQQKNTTTTPKYITDSDFAVRDQKVVSYSRDIAAIGFTCLDLLRYAQVLLGDERAMKIRTLSSKAADTVLKDMIKYIKKYVMAENYQVRPNAQELKMKLEEFASRLAAVADSSDSLAQTA